jgi:hypothetical protein
MVPCPYFESFGETRRRVNEKTRWRICPNNPHLFSYYQPQPRPARGQELEPETQSVDLFSLKGRAVFGGAL